jgi:hypothetical protein
MLRELLGTLELEPHSLRGYFSAAKSTTMHTVRGRAIATETPVAAAARSLIIQRYGFTPMVFELARRLVESKGTDDVRTRWSAEYGGYSAAVLHRFIR